MKFARARTEKDAGPQVVGFDDLRTGCVQSSQDVQGAIGAPLMAAIVTDELQPIEIAVVTAAIRAFEFHSRKN